ncbi:MAG: chloride channel protein [Planctomycetota bacterium]
MSTDQEPDGAPAELGDFTATRRLVPICFIAVGIGVVSAFVAVALLQLIALFTNVFYYQRISTAFASPAEHHLGLVAVLLPVAGALIIGLMARYGSERIRGHGIPEALEAILIRVSRVEPRLAVLKPISSAISIGSGGPFGAEGPIIMTGGAFGSILAQFFHLTNAERKTLMVAGAAGGMSATFASPIAAVLLAVELLLFEWKPRSCIPVALASATAMAARHSLLGPGPIFPVPAHADYVGVAALLLCALAGLLAGSLSGLLTLSVYFFEDLFAKLKLHWMWWPAIGGLVIGLGGLVEPRALGVGYDVIEELLRGHMLARQILVLVLVKWAIWSCSLGSGTSGGVLAPLLILGGALGGLEASIFPDHGIGFWVLVSMGAILGGTMRAPFTGVVFIVELTHDMDMLLPLMVATVTAYAFTVLVLRRSILTEKVARRGYHVSREYGVDPLEVLFVREVMRSDVVALDSSRSPAEAQDLFAEKDQRLYPVTDDQGDLQGVITSREVRRWALDPERAGWRLADLATRDPVTAHPDETLRVVAYRMAESGRTRVPVVSADRKKVLGLLTLADLFKARILHLEEESRREQVLSVPFVPARPAAAPRAVRGAL